MQTKVLEYILNIDNNEFKLKDYMEQYYLKSLRFLEDYSNIPVKKNSNQERINFCKQIFDNYYNQYNNFNIVESIKKMVSIRNYKFMSNEELLSLSKNENFDLSSISNLIETTNFKPNPFLKEYINRNIKESHLIYIIDNLQNNFEKINFFNKNNSYTYILDETEHKKINSYIYFFYENNDLFDLLDNLQKEKINFFKKAFHIVNSQEALSEDDFIFSLEFENIPNFLNIKFNKNTKKRRI